MKDKNAIKTSKQNTKSLKKAAEGPSSPGSSNAGFTGFTSNKHNKPPNKPGTLDPKLLENFISKSTKQPVINKKRTANERSPNSKSPDQNLPAKKPNKNERITYVESSIEGSTDSLALTVQDMNQMWDETSESTKKLMKNSLGLDKKGSQQGQPLDRQGHQSTPGPGPEVNKVSSTEGKVNKTQSNNNKIKRGHTTNDANGVRDNMSPIADPKEANVEGNPSSDAKVQNGGSDDDEGNHGDEDIADASNDEGDGDTDDESTKSKSDGGDNKDDDIIMVMEFQSEDSDFLACPVEINNALRNSIIARKDVKEVKTNLKRNMLIIVADHRHLAEKWLNIKSFGGRNVNCRWTIQTDNSNTSYGVIGPISCPIDKEIMLRKKAEYMNIINESNAPSNAPVIALEWISKREKVNDEWITKFSQSIRLQFAGDVPDKVFMDRISYTVGEYVQEPVQC